MRASERALFAALSALLLYGFWQAGLFQQTIWTVAGLRRLAGVSAIYFAAASLVVWLRPRVRRPIIDWLEIPLAAAILATAFGLLAHFRINYWWLWALFVVIAGSVILRSRRYGTVDMTRREWAAFALTGFPLLLNLLAAMSPESSGDGLAMHLVIPEWIAFHHAWSFDAERLAWAVMPMNGDWMASIAFLIGGELAAKFLNWIWLATLCGGLFRVLRWTLSRDQAWIGVALFASTPVVFLVTGSLFVENLWALFLFAGVLALWDGRVVASGILLGAAMGTKFGSLAMVLVAIPLLLWKVQGDRKAVAKWLTAFVVVGCIPYLTAYVLTGNPVFPFFNGTFHSALYDAKDIVDPRFPRGVTWRLLYDATVYSSRYLESQNGVAGFQWLLFLPLAALSWTRLGQAARLCLVVGIAFVVLEFQAFAYLRYAFPAMLLLSVPIASVVTRDRWLAGAAVILFAGNIYFLGGSGFQHRDLFLNWFDPVEREHFTEFYTPQRRLIAELNRIAPGQPVAFLAGNQIAGVQAPVYTASWHSWKFEKALQNAAAPEDVLKLIERFGIRYVIAPAESSAVQMASVQARNMLQMCSKPVMDYGGFRLAKVSESCGEHSRPAAPPGTYDDKDIRILYRGAWSRDSQFPETFNHTVTYSAVADESFKMAFEGSKITWVFTRAPNRGIAQVSIDGVNRGVIDLYAANPEWQAQQTFDLGVPGSHVFEVRVTGLSNRAAVGFYVDVDALIVE